MNNITKPIKTIIDNLQERAKELNCLYKIEELLSNPETSLESILHEIVDLIPLGWQYTDVCQVRIVFDDMKSAEKLKFATQKKCRLKKEALS